MSSLNARGGAVHRALDFGVGVCDVANFEDHGSDLRKLYFTTESWMMSGAKSTLKIHIVGEQVAAARQLLRMTQIELAAATGLTHITIVRFEGGANVRPETIEAVREALIERGIEFLNGGEPGVRLRKIKPED